VVCRVRVLSSKDPFLGDTEACRNASILDHRDVLGVGWLVGHCWRHSEAVG
jgi:hypothetical protein